LNNEIVTIVGCGALGSLLAVRLIENGLTVQVFQRDGDQLAALRQPGITIEGDGPLSPRNVALDTVSADPSQMARSRLVIVLVKSYNTSSLEPVRKFLADDGVVLTLQNGLGNSETLADFFGSGRVAAGVATYGAFRTAPGTIAWGGDGQVSFGPWDSRQDHSWIARWLTKGSLNVAYQSDPRPALWRKLIMNAMVNPVTALTRMRNGQMLESPWTIELMQGLGNEAVTAAARAGIELDFDQAWETLQENLRLTGANRNSMLQDIEAGRRTEIDAILGSILRYATNDADFPVTRTVYQLIKAISG
jgi:2-dehydropantoate 2-reductase